MNERAVKIVIRRRRGKIACAPENVAVVDVESGQPLPVKDVRLDFPLEGVTLATVQLVVADIEVVDAPDWETR